MKKPSKILIYRIGNLGDIICAIPAMVAVRERYPEAWIGLLTNKEVSGNPDAEEILKGNDFIDEIITYFPNRLRDFRYVIDFFYRIHSLKIDIVVCLAISSSSYMRLIRDWIFFRAIGIRKIVGLKKPKAIGINFVQGVSIPIFPQEVDRTMALLNPLGIDSSKVIFRLPIQEKEKKNITSVWDHFGLVGKFPVIAICLGAKFPAKRWPIANFIKVVLILQQEFSGRIILVGGPGDQISGAEVMKKIQASVINLIGKTTYMETAEIITRCHLLVSNDCGPVHLAAAVGTPVVGIYSSRDRYGAWHPWGKNHTVLRNDLLNCRFCFRVECKSMECIKNITVGQVMDACKKYLKK